MARQDLGLTESDFWSLSPRLYRALLDRQRARTRALEEAANLRAGVIASAVLNSVGGKKNGGSFQAKDFFVFEQQASNRQLRPSTEPLPDAEQAAVEAGWLTWAAAATAAASAKR